MVGAGATDGGGAVGVAGAWARASGLRDSLQAVLPFALTEAQQRAHDNARRVLQDLALPWEPLLATVEQAVDADTALLAVEPDATRRGLTLGG